MGPIMPTTIYIGAMPVRVTRHTRLCQEQFVNEFKCAMPTLLTILYALHERGTSLGRMRRAQHSSGDGYDQAKSTSGKK
jgi:hypothetical protein